MTALIVLLEVALAGVAVAIAVGSPLAGMKAERVVEQKFAAENAGSAREGERDPVAA